MATDVSKVLRHLHGLLAPPGGDQTDGGLLARFVATRDEASFAALVRRHGPMVLSVCRRMLRHAQDAEDCFQATFMVLARKAATVKLDAVGSWLYAVAYRTSLEAKSINARRRARERQVQDMPHPEVLQPEAQDWRPRLDQELNRLPERYRAAIVACELEGRSRKEAARQLGISEGTLSSRLARGRRLLAKRLAPYGLALPSAALAAALAPSVASAQVPAALVSHTTNAALLAAAGEWTTLSASSAILMKGVLKSMFAAKLKLMVGAVMVVTALGASRLAYRAVGQSVPLAETRFDGKPKNELERLRHENELLKLNLEVVLEKIRAQEAELHTLRERTKDHAVKLFKFEQQPKKEQQQKEMHQNSGQSPQGHGNKIPSTRKSQGEAKDSATFKNQLDKAQSDLFLWYERANWSQRMSQPGRQYLTVAQAEADQARFRSALLDQAEAALKVLRAAPDAESRRKAADALDRVLKKLYGQTQQPDGGNRK